MIYKVLFTIKKDMDEQTARAKLDTIAGYVHPTNIKPNRGNLYKTFSDTETYTKASIDAFKTTTVGKTYASVGTDLVKDLCPTCKGEATFVCPCVFSDKTCKNGHTWYYDRDDGKIRKGKPH